MSFAPPPPRASSVPSAIGDLEPRPAFDEKLKDFVHVNHIEHREKCHAERTWDIEKHAGVHIDHPQSTFEWPDETSSVRVRLKKMLTTFPYRDPIYLVAIVFLLGSIALVINAFLDLVPRVLPGTAFETTESVAVPTTVLIGSILFFAAGIFDTFGALNADAGTLKEVDGKITYRPALLGSAEFKWVPAKQKLLDLSVNNLAFQAGLLVLFGGVIFMFGGIVDFPGVIPEEDNPFFELVVFGPQIIHGALFFVANILLAVSELESWYKPDIWDADWQGAVVNAVGGFGFMVAGYFMVQKAEVMAAVASLVGGCAFVGGSVIRWYVVMEVP
jgi:hypothetical protein